MIDDFKKYILKVMTIVSACGAIILSLIIFIKLFFDKSYGYDKEFIIFSTSAIAVILGMTLAMLAKYTFQKRKGILYISHSLKDTDFAHKLARDLNKYGFKTIIAEDEVLIGDGIQDKINMYISLADFFVVLISKNFNGGEWFEKELSSAKNKNKKIFPVKIDETEIPEELSSIKYADLKDKYNLQLKLLVKSLEKNLILKKI
jgi:hypothetical protein